MDIKLLIKQLEERKTEVGKERDRLTDLMNETTGLEETCERAYDSLVNAIDALSELV